MNMPPSLALLSALTRTPTSKPKKGKAPKRKSFRERNADALAERRAKSIEDNDERRARSAARKESARARDTARSADRKAKGILPNPINYPSLPASLVPGQSGPNLVPSMRRINPGRVRAGDPMVGPPSSLAPQAPVGPPAPQGPTATPPPQPLGPVGTGAPLAPHGQDRYDDLNDAILDPQAINAIATLARLLNMNR